MAGRGGMFRYYNMDHAIESGISTAEKIIENRVQEKGVRGQNEKENLRELPEIYEESGICGNSVC
jgi:hypothetical protein